MIPRIKKIIRSFSIKECENLVQEILDLSSEIEITNKAQKFFHQKISNDDLLIKRR
jgi:phosphoenolpyruvate-protein kinase (PTS system EI component)